MHPGVSPNVSWCFRKDIIKDFTSSSEGIMKELIRGESPFNGKSHFAVVGTEGSTML